MKTVRFHPLANLFPLLEGEAFAALKNDIASNGLREPIVLHEELILDGRNRYRACDGTTKATFTAYDGNDPLGFVVSMNLHRRHLDESQRAMVAAKLATMKVGDNRGAHRPAKGSANLQTLPGVSRPDAAKTLGVSTRSVASAASVRANGTPALIKVVEQGRMPVSVAAKVAKLSKEQQGIAAAAPERAKHLVKHTERNDREAALAERTVAASRKLGKTLYGVIYADPPWRFEPYSRDSGMDRAADNHYPTMTLDKIKAMKVPAADDCVLFLWATAPMLPEALEVMQAWGFAYKSHCVWLKDRMGTGYWFRNKHELLLVGTRGNIPAPAQGDQYVSVIDAKVGGHSTKPEHFAEMIDEMFPNLSGIELFARGSRAGWDVWGAESDVRH